MYTEKELAGIAKRENNNKRRYLVVNRLQGKHVPVSPQKALGMFHALAELVKKEYEGECLLLVGFAETATAIGAALAIECDTYYMQTTRENVEGVDYLYFSESHSHATEQKLVRTDLDKVIDKIDRIIFVEDEVTTGNTILKIIRLIQKEYTRKIPFSVAALLNGMNREAEEVYERESIRMHYLVKTSHDAYTQIAEGYRGDGSYFDCRSGFREIREIPDGGDAVTVAEKGISGRMNARRLNKGCSYREACETLWREVRKETNLQRQKKILVIGTEEFMYPALFIGGKLEEEGHTVKCHSTTRSPIAVSTETEYPLHARYELASLYDRERKTFLYDLAEYEEVLVITDAEGKEEGGWKSLLFALVSCGNRHINLIRWC